MIRELSNNEVNALHYELLMRDIISAAEKLPPFPDVAWKITSLIRKMAPPKELESVIRLDQALSARIIRLSQGVCFGRRYDVRSLQDAMLLLGNKRLLQVIISTCASRYFERVGCGQDERDMWEHSVATALMSEIVCRSLGHKKIITVYTAALLHDIGKTILSIYAKIYLHQNLHRIRGNGNCVKSEQRAMGIDHQELGGMIARNWKFPAELTAAIQHHHDPDNAGQYKDIASIVYVANELAELAVDTPESAHSPTIDPERDPVFRRMGISLKMAEEFLVLLTKNLHGVKRMLAG